MKHFKKIIFITSAAVDLNDAVTGRIEGYKIFCTRYDYKFNVISASLFHGCKILNSNKLLLPLKSILIYLEMLYAVSTNDFEDSRIIISIPKYFTFFSILPILKVKSLDYIVEYRDAYPRVIFEKLRLPKKIVDYLSEKIIKYTHRNNDTIFFTDRFDLLKEYDSLKSFFVPNGASISNSESDDRLAHQNFDEIRICSVGRLGKFQSGKLIDEEIKELVISDLVSNILICGDILNLKLDKLINLGRITSHEISQLTETCNIGLSYRDESLSSDVNIPVRIWEYLNAGLYIRANKTTALKILRDQLWERFSIAPFSFIEDESIEELLQKVKLMPRFNELVGQFTRLKNLENSNLIEILK